MRPHTLHPAHFIGYTTLEEWACHTERQQPVYVTLVEQPAAGTATIEQRQVCVLVQQITAQGDVCYCRLPIGWQTYSQGLPFDLREHAVRHERYTQAYRLIQDWLRTTSGYAYLHEATVAHPADLRWLDGVAEFLLFDKEHKHFYRK